MPKLKLIGDKHGFMYDENSAMYLRADMMLDYLYEKPIGAKESKVKDIFYF
jgi:hypothetical protein